jgi:hypothetical protein
MTPIPDTMWVFPKKDWFNAGASTHKISGAGAKDVEYTRADLMATWSTDMESICSGESYIVYAHGYVITATKMGTHWMNKGEEIYPTHWMALPNSPEETK